MRFFGLTPDQVLSRVADPATAAPRAPSLGLSIFHGAVGLALVSVAAYSIWALRILGGGAMWFAVAAIYIALGGVVLGRLVIGPGATARFAGLFAVAFFTYAAAFCTFWFTLKGKYYADLWGSAVGLVLMTFFMMRAFEKRDGFWLLFLGLLAFHSLGYYAGGVLSPQFPGSTGRLLYGACHGLGFGAGLGFVLFHAQSGIKARLRPA